MPELPWVKRERYKKDYGMTDKEVAVFIESPKIAEYFEKIIGKRVFDKDGEFIKLTTNYLLSDYLGLLKKEGLDIESSIDLIIPAAFEELISMTDTNKISSRGAKDLLSFLIKEAGSMPSQLAEKHNLLQKSDAGEIEPIIERVIADNAKVVAEYKAGKTASLQFLIGQAMKAAKGAANPTVIKELLVKKLG